jgi:hypothetical protein
MVQDVVLWVVTPCGLVSACRYFGEKLCFNFPLGYTGKLEARLSLRSEGEAHWKWGQNISRKHQHPHTRSHVVTTQNITIWTFTAVKTSEFRRELTKYLSNIQIVCNIAEQECRCSQALCCVGTDLANNTYKWKTTGQIRDCRPILCVGGQALVLIRGIIK